VPFWTRSLFDDRGDAGRQLAARLAGMKREKPIVAGMVRGGIPVAAEVALALEAPLVPVIVQKIGAPGQPELAMGAIVDGATPEVIWNEDVVHAVCASQGCLDKALAEARGRLEQRREQYPGAGAYPLEGRTVIVVDDGIATGASVRAALKAIRTGRPKAIVLAVPVVIGGRANRFGDVADTVVVLAEPVGMSAVGAAYRDFGQVSHAEARAAIERATAVHERGESYA
jgi:predicted phosphoribosyltransferase